MILPVFLAVLASGFIEGKVLDSTNGEPLPYAKVMLDSPALAEPRLVVVGADGAYRFDGLPDGEYEIQFRYGMGSDFDHFTVGETRGWLLNKPLYPYPDCILIQILPRIPSIDASTAQQGVTVDQSYLRNIPGH